MTPRIRKRLRHGTMLLFLGAAICGCSAAKPSNDYLKSLEQAAMRGEVQSGTLDVARECPTCSPDEAIFAQQIVDAEQRFGARCEEIPAAEASYRMIRTMMQPNDLVPGYQNFVDGRMCQVAEKYQACAAPGHRAVSAGDSTGPAGALNAAIDQCRAHNPSEADEIVNRAVALESESINRAVLSGDYADATPELRIYAALPRSSRQRAEEWRISIADEEVAAKTRSALTSTELKGMVCEDSYFVRNPETGYGNMVGGLNMRHGGRIGSDNPFEPVSKTDTKESRMASLVWELSNADEISTADAQKMLERAYARAARDPSYCRGATR